MRRHMEHSAGLSTILGGAALGALAMYLLDPDKGRRRRALARDRARSLVTGARGFVDTASRDVGHRLHGLQAQAVRTFRRRETPDDLVLIERVRARMGRVVSHPHAIQIGARDGHVTLSGPILEREVGPLLDAVQSVPGVAGVEDHLVVPDHPETVPSLQGGNRRREIRAEIMQENWTPALRVAAMLGGGALAAQGLRHRSLAGAALAALGLALTARGVTNQPVQRLAGMARGRRAINLQKTIHIAAPPDLLYDLWADSTSFPRFMSHVEEVRDLGGGRTHWVMTGPAGSRLEWDAVVTQAIRPEILSWRTEPGSVVQHAGTVQFEPYDNGTRLSVKMTYNAAGALGHAVATLFGHSPKQQMDDDLMRMKALVEQGAVPRDAMARQGERPALH